MDPGEISGSEPDQNQKIYLIHFSGSDLVWNRIFYPDPDWVNYPLKIQMDYLDQNQIKNGEIDPGEFFCSDLIRNRIFHPDPEWVNFPLRIWVNSPVLIWFRAE